MSGRGKDNKFRREGDLTDKEWSSVNRKSDGEGRGSVFVFRRHVTRTCGELCDEMNGQSISPSCEVSRGAGGRKYKLCNETLASELSSEEEYVLHTKNATQRPARYSDRISRRYIKMLTPSGRE